MEVLYFIDGSITGFLQDISEVLKKKIRLQLRVQRLILMFALITTSAFWGNLYLPLSAMGITLNLVAFFTLVFGSIFGILFFGIILYLLHIKIKPDRELMSEKEYPYGEVAWGGVIYIASIMLSTKLMSWDTFNYGFKLASLILIAESYTFFVAGRRPEDGKRRRHKESSKLLDSLLEKVAERARWNPLPVPSS